MSKHSEALLSDMQQWASNNQNVSEFWLLGGQLRDEAQPGSDVELAIVLMTPTPGSDWALTNASLGKTVRRAARGFSYCWNETRLACCSELSSLSGTCRNSHASANFSSFVCALDIQWQRNCTGRIERLGRGTYRALKD